MLLRFHRSYPTLSLPIILAALAVSSTAAAVEPERAPATTSSTESRGVSLTTDPTRPLVGMGIVHGEVRFPRMNVIPQHRPIDVSLGAWIAAGRMRGADDKRVVPIWSDCADLTYCDRSTVVWVGAQALMYPVGSFDHGMQLGLEASLMHTWGTRRYSSSYQELAGAVAQIRDIPFHGMADRSVESSVFLPGIVIGYKLVTKSGFTFNPQLAGDLLVSSEPPTLAPRLALNAGWSF